MRVAAQGILCFSIVCIRGCPVLLCVGEGALRQLSRSSQPQHWNIPHLLAGELGVSVDSPVVSEAAATHVGERGHPHDAT